MLPALVRVVGEVVCANRIVAAAHDDHRAAVDVGVGGIEDDLAVVPPLVEEAEDAVVRLCIDARHRLVEEDDVGLLGDGAGDEGAALLAAGQLADLASGKGADAEMGQRMLDDVVVLGVRALEPAAARVAPHHHDVADGDGE